jgi:hypothetical protein
MGRISVTAKDAIERVKALSREELLELITANFFYVASFSERDVNAAKARVLRKKANAAFEQYETFEVPELPTAATFEQIAEHFKLYQKKEQFYERYKKLWDKADKLEFGKE